MTQISSIPVGHFADIPEVAGAPRRVHYHDLGKGEAVIFLHGAGAGASGYSNFKGNYPVFAQGGYRTIVPDLLGFGLSSKPDIPMYDLDFFVAGVKGLIDALGLNKVTLLGNSLGGAVALGYALAYPNEVDRLILMVAAKPGLKCLAAFSLCRWSYGVNRATNASTSENRYRLDGQSIALCDGGPNPIGWPDDGSRRTPHLG